jgi:AcrR family transcriptional regulator
MTSKQETTPAPHGSRTHAAKATPPHTTGDPILDAAAYCLDKYGWSATTVERVAVQSKKPLAEVLQKYPSRDHLAAAIMRRMLDQLPVEFADEIDADATLSDRLYTAIAHELRTLEPHKAFVRELVRTSVNPLSPSMVMQAREVLHYLTFITEQIRVGKHRGEISAWIVPSLAASAFWLLHLRVINFWLRDDSPYSEQTHARVDRWIRQFVFTLGGARVGRDPTRRIESDPVRSSEPGPTTSS